MNPTRTPLINAEYAGLVTGCQSRLYAYIVSLMGQREAAMDVLQETNRVLLEKAERFEMGTHFTAWAMQIARYEVLKALRQAAPGRLTFDAPLLEQLADAAEREADRADAELRAMAHCVDRLPEAARGLIADRYERGASVNALAADRRQKPNTVAKTLHRIRLQLMDCIQRRLARAEGGAGVSGVSGGEA